MAETYCGKTCAECGSKEALNCPGCKVGPGRRFEGDCELAQCCREKGHEECQSCGHNGKCGKLRGRERVPDHRRRKLALEAERTASLVKRVPLLRKWLWILFWLVVPATLASLLTSGTNTEGGATLYITGSVLEVLCSAAYGFALLKLAAEEDRYRTAGICCFISAGISVILSLVSDKIGNWIWLIHVPSMVVSLIGEYNEYLAHAEILSDVDTELSAQWGKLWVWYIIMLVATFGSILVALISAVLGVLLMLVGTMGMLIVGIVKLVYLYKTAKLYRDIPLDEFAAE